jgi:hypothetical protein
MNSGQSFMSRTTERARSSFYRSGGALRLATVIAMLVVVGMLMNRASDPKNWVWLTGKPSGDKTMAGAVAEAEQPAPIQVSPGPTDTDPEEREGASEQFQAISDRTIELAREEMPAYWRLFGWASHQSLAELQQRANQAAVLNQFIQTPDEQRGKLFQLDLNVRRVLSYDAPANSAGIKKVYEIWGWTTESKAWLYVVLTTHLPPGMPVGPDVNERITFAGYFLKVQGYHAAGAGPRDKPLAAPLLIGRLAWKSSPAPVSANAADRWMQGTITFLLLLGAVGLAIWMFIPKRTDRQRTASTLGHASSPRSEIRDWLAHAERRPTNDETSDADFRFHDN